ncbi:MAG: hypothetical protein IV097_13730 [Burkholderiaceae bacterium]|nr:hypothetical protein [Burkholderiaceae bacterium]
MAIINANTSSNNSAGIADTGSGLDGLLDSAHTDDLVSRVAKSAHETVDRLAATAGPAVDRIRRGVDQASDSVHAGADRLSETQQEWTESLRCTVREHPLAALATAVALGVLVSRLAR